MIGIICAMDKEAEKLKAAMVGATVERIGRLEFTTGTLMGREAVIGMAGIGKVNAAMCAEAMILRYGPSLIVNSGVILHDAWEIVARGNKGTFSDLMLRSCEAMRTGRSDVDAIYEFGYLTDSEEIKKFTSALIQSVERGGGELPSFLSNQSKELWNHHRQYMLQQGEKAAGALLMPIALMFVGVMCIVLVAALQSVF